MSHYGQYCPIAKSLELLAERWTLLVVRELLMGSRRFSELQRGVPLMNPTMLSQRLKTLVRSGVVTSEPGPGGRSRNYRLTPAGEELRPLIVQLGSWGQRWYRSRMTADDLDAGFLMWDVRRNLQTSNLPKRAVIFFEFCDAKKGMRHWWLVVDGSDVDLCLKDPGREVDLALSVSVRTMTQIWMGDLTLDRARASGVLKVSGAPRLARSIGSWLGASPFAHVAPAASRPTQSG